MSGEPTATRIPPHDLDAEGAVLSAVMVDPTALDKVATFLKPEHFYSEAHRRIFAACVDLSATGRPVDVVQVATLLRDHDRLAQVGGMAYLTEVLNSAPAVANVEAYAETVRQKALVRAIIGAAQCIEAEGYAAVADVPAFVESSETRLYEIARAGGVRQAGERMRDVIGRTLTKMALAHDEGAGKMLGIPTGLVQLDEVTGGLFAGEHTVVAARPGMGKTALALNIGTTLALRGLGVIVFSQEMPSEQCAMRLLCSGAGVDVRHARTNRLTADDWTRLVAAGERLGRPEHFIVEERRCSLAEMRAIVRVRDAAMARARVQLALVIVDYAQIMLAPADFNGRERAEHALAVNARGLKGLAKDTGAHVLTLSQLNRNVEARTDKRPLLGDLRESGALEEAADVAIGIYRDEYYNLETKRPGVAELLILKQRNGPTCTVELAFDGPTASFDDLERLRDESHTEACGCEGCRRAGGSFPARGVRRDLPTPQ